MPPLSVTSRGLYDPELRRELIHIPHAVVTFFGQRGTHIPLPKRDDTNKALITYNTILGKDAEDVPREFFNDEELMAKEEEYAFKNTSEESKRKADNAAIRAIKSIFGQGRYSSISKSYMINTSTMPVKIRFCEDDKKSKHILYVKRPDTNRIVGRFIYDLISGFEGIRYGFNKAVFLEEGLRASPLSRLNEEELLRQEVYKMGIVRAAVHTDFMALNDVRNPRNRLIDMKYNTILFDFNLMFGKTNSIESTLLGNYRNVKGFYTKDVLDALNEEKLLVASRANQRHKCLFKLARIVGSLIDYTQETLDQRVRKFYDAENVEDYFEKKINEFRNG